MRALEPAFVSAPDENVNACDPVDFRVAAFSQHDGGEEITMASKNIRNDGVQCLEQHQIRDQCDLAKP